MVVSIHIVVSTYRYCQSIGPFYNYKESIAPRKEILHVNMKTIGVDIYA